MRSLNGTQLDLDFSFEVGVTEVHRVNVRWGQTWGIAEIRVDGVEVLRERHLFGLHLTRTYEVSVGTNEVHTVVVHKTKARFYGGIRKQRFDVLVDGQPLGSY